MLLHRYQYAQIMLNTSCVVIANILLEHLNKVVLAGEPSAIDDFNFGSVLLFNTSRLKEAAGRITSEYNFAGLYGLHLR